MVRVVAFYLPQFYPFPENDRWWGKGFTEWTNVTRAQPLFEHHYQPRLPADLGFYDLRVWATRHEQERLAKEHGIDAFCYYYCWFSGTRLLNRPLDEMLTDPASDMPFCLCWTNESWTRRWDGAEKQILIEQKYLPEDDLKFIKSVEPFMLDKRYLRLDGAPLLIVYVPQQLPDAGKSIAVWREYWRSQGHGELHLCAALTHNNEDHAQFGFDSGVEFPPHNLRGENVTSEITFYRAFRGTVKQYASVAREYLERRYANPNVFRSVFPSWDNTARTNEGALVILNGTPANYEYWLAEALRRTRHDHPGKEWLVFINAWNEWAEGCYLEPDRRHGGEFLEATRRAVAGESVLEDFTHTGLPAPGDVHRDFLAELAEIIEYHIQLRIGKLRLWLKRHPRLKILVRALLSPYRRLRVWNAARRSRR